MPKLKSSKPKAVGAYIFAGGFTVGVMKHFRVLCHLEENDYGAKTARRNFPVLPIHVGFDSWPTSQLWKEQIDFLYGNPPCAAWSVAGYTKTRGTDKWKTDDRVNCTRRHFQLLSELEPKVWAWESVTQAYSKGKEFCDYLAEEAARLGYSTTYLLHDAQWFGLPQIRRRFFMVYHRIKFGPIQPFWDSPPIPITILGKARVGEPFGRRSVSENVLVATKPGERLAKCWCRVEGGPDPNQWEKNKTGGVKGRPPFGLVRLPVDRPGGAIVGYEMVHPTEDRWLSTEELQVLNGFPPDYIFTPIRAQGRANEIARGVCPPVGEWLAKSVAMSLKANVRVRKPTVTLIDYRKPGIDPVDLTKEYV